MTTSAAESLWLDTAPTTRHPPLKKDLDVDVAVLGGGITGLTTAHLLKEAGADVVVLEAERVGTGVTGTNTAKVSALQQTVYSQIRSRHGDEGVRVYGAASLAGVGEVERLTNELAIECALERAPAVTYGDASTVEREADACRTAGLRVETTADAGLPYAVDAAVRLDEQIRLQPTRYAQGLAEAIGSVHERTRVLGVRDGSPCEVHTTRGTVRAKQVVVATHYPLLDRGLYFARVDQQRSYCIAARIKGTPPDTMAISAGSPTRSINRFGELLIVGGEGHSPGAGKATPERFAKLEEFAREHWDVQEVTHRWSAQDPIVYDHLPIVGPYTPRTRRLFVASGFHKWGLSGGTAAGLLLRDLLAGRDHPWAEAFSPSRFTPRGLPKVAQLGAKFSADMVLDRVKPPQLGDIRPGEAKVRRDGLAGKKGVYRDDDGNLHAVSLRCTHLGCLVRWNGAERSWDCPCHGSRFDVDGSVLEGPAVKPLERRTP